MNKYKGLITDTILFALGNLGTKFILFVLLPVYTYTMSVAEYGTVEYIETLTNLIYPIISLVINEAILRFSISQIEKREEVLRAGIIVLLISSILTIIAVTIIRENSIIGEWKWYFCFNIIISMFYQLIMAYIKATGEIKTYSILSIVHTFTLAVLNIFFLVWLKMGIEGYLRALLCSRSIICIWGIVFGGIGREFFRAKLNISLLIRMIKYSAPLVVNNISWWVMQSLDKLMIKEIVDVDALGLYTVASKIPALINMFVTVFSQAWRISAIREYDSKNDKNFYSTVLKVYSFFIPLVAAMVIVMIKPFMKIYVSEEFFDAWKYIPLLVVGASFSALSAFYESIYNALEKSTRCMITALIAASTNFVLNFIMIPKIGIMGAVIATVISYGLIAICRIIDIYFLFTFKIYPMKMLINYGTIILLSIFILKSKIECLFLVVVIVVNNISLIKELTNRGEK